MEPLYLGEREEALARRIAGNALAIATICRKLGPGDRRELGRLFEESRALGLEREALLLHLVTDGVPVGEAVIRLHARLRESA